MTTIIRIFVAAVAVGVALSISASPVTQLSGAAPGRVLGTVKVAGKVPSLPARPVTKDGAMCGVSKLPPVALMVDKSGALSNAVVTIEGLQSDGGEPAPVRLAQKGCEYVPHVQVARVGALMRIVNEDDVMHNVHAFDDKGESLFNIAQPLKGLTNRYTLKAPATLKVVCDSGHPWMRAYVVVTDHPYAAVTGADGSFMLSDVPPGTHKISMWHEYVGRMQQTVVVGAGADARVTFSAPIPAAPAVP
jgi:plastocyanin